MKRDSRQMRGMSDTPSSDPLATLHLGQSSALPASPEAATLDYVPNPRTGALYLVRFAAPEFTSLCPVTGQPDFAHLVIDYAPVDRIVESKSLKLFLGSFRNHAGFHEDVTVGIGQRHRPALNAADQIAIAIDRRKFLKMASSVHLCQCPQWTSSQLRLTVFHLAFAAYEQKTATHTWQTSNHPHKPLALHAG